MDVSVTMQLKFQQSTVEFFMVPQLQFIDRVVVQMLHRDRYTVHTVQKSVEVAQVQSLDWLAHLLLSNDRCLGWTEQKTVEVQQLQCSDKVNDVPVVQVVVHVEGASDSVHRQSWVMTAVKGGFSAFCAFFALLRVVPELSASRSLGALDDEEFFVIEGWGVALTPGVELPGVRPPVVHELVACLALFWIFRVWTNTCVNASPKQQQQQPQQHTATP